MAILVTGGAGYIGSHVLLELVARGKDIIVLDDISTGDRKAVPPGLELWTADCLDVDVLHNIFVSFDIDTVIHLAAKISVPESVSDPCSYYEANIGGTLNVLARAADHGVKNFIFASSAAVYSRNSPTGHEMATIDPVSPYGHTKAFGERMVADICQRHDMNYANLRFFNVGGADDELRAGPTKHTSGIVRKIAQFATGVTSELVVNGVTHPTFDGFAVRDYIHVTDVAKAIIEAMDYITDRKIVGNGILVNVGTGTHTSIRRLIQSAEEVTGKTMPYTVGKAENHDVPTMVSSFGALNSLTGWLPINSSAFNIMKTAIDWENAHK